MNYIVNPLVSSNTRYPQLNNPQQTSGILSGVDLIIGQDIITPRLRGSLAAENRTGYICLYTTGSKEIEVIDNSNGKSIKKIKLTAPLTAKKFKEDGIQTEIVAGFVDKKMFGRDFKISLEGYKADGSKVSSEIKEFSSKAISKKSHILDADAPILTGNFIANMQGKASISILNNETKFDLPIKGSAVYQSRDYDRVLYITGSREIRICNTQGQTIKNITLPTELKTHFEYGTQTELICETYKSFGMHGMHDGAYSNLSYSGGIGIAIKAKVIGVNSFTDDEDASNTISNSAFEHFINQTKLDLIK